MSKQTSVEWLIQELQLFYLNRSKLTYNEILEQAKEMHRQEIIDAVGAPIIGEQYYNETYGGNKQAFDSGQNI